MKFLLISLAVIYASLAIPLEEVEQNQIVGDIFGDLINNTINKILANMSDPLKIDKVPITFNQAEKIEGSANLTKISIAGLSSLVATYIKVNIAKLDLDMEIKIPSINVLFDYWLDVLLLDIVPLYGSGHNSINVEGIQLNVTGKANITGGLQVSNLTVIVNLDTATFSLNGLLDNPEFSALVSTALNDNFVNFVNDNNKLLSKLIGSILEDIINGVLSVGNYYKEIIQQYTS